MAQVAPVQGKNAAPKTVSHRDRSNKQKPAPVPEPPQPPPPPPTPEQMPPVPPQVTYKNGQLTIVANNSTLGDILHAVAVRTGATIDAPGNLTSERVATRIGPGSPRDVLAMLLEGPHIQYVLVGSDGDPNVVRSIILTASASAPGGSAAPTSAFQTVTRQSAPPREEMEEDIQADEQPESQQPAMQQIMPQQPPQGRPAEGYFVNPQQQQQQVKTPEQLLEELRRLQQQGNQPQSGPTTR